MSHDVCVIGSGAGGGPVAARVAEAGYRVLVLEKGPWYEREAFLKDEIAVCRRPTFWPSTEDEPQVMEWEDSRGALRATRTGLFHNGSLVGGSSVLMSGFFLRLKPADFRMLSTYGPVEGADVADWPITYDDLEPWYAQVEEDVGVSGLPWDDLPPAIRDRRSTPDMPFLPTREHPLADRIDRTCAAMGLHPFPTPRAVLPEDRGGRRGCAYTGYCGSYGCRTGAKGSALEVWLSRALATGRCEIRPRSMVTRLISDARGRVVAAETRDGRGTSRRVEADVFVVACQAVETARLLLASPGPRHPRGLANGSGHVGRHLISSTFAAGWGDFPYGAQEDDAWLRSKETFVNRSLQDWYFIDDTRTGGLGRRKGGTLDFLLHHPNPIGAAVRLATEDGTGREDNTGRGDGSGRFAWGRALRDRIRGWFRESRHLKFEVFGEWLPDRRCGVALDPTTKDRWGLPVARVNVTSHPRNRETAAFLAERGIEVLAALGARDPRTVRSYGGPSTNLLGGTCRFGEDPARSVLDPDCRAHDAENLFVTDGSFMPSGGGVPFTFTIYANALRVAERIVEQLGGPRR